MLLFIVLTGRINCLFASSACEISAVLDLLGCPIDYFMRRDSQIVVLAGSASVCHAETRFNFGLPHAGMTIAFHALMIN